MLRWSRPLRLRQFSTSGARWNVRRPESANFQHRDTPSNLQTAGTPESISEDTVVKTDTPLPTESNAESRTPPESRENLPPYDLDLVKNRIREWSEQATIILRNRADDFTASTKTTFSQLGSQLNRVTGYEEIEALKRGVVAQEDRINAARQAARAAKSAFEQAVVQRSNSQREVNDLLQRKSSWTDSDVGRFTTLVRQDHLYEQEEFRAKTSVDETEEAVEREFSELLRKILARYHEEQVWSDKIRSASTYGSLAALGLNMLVFIMAIVIVEPWKRKRLAQTFERKIEELSSDNEARLDASMQSIGQLITRQAELTEALKEEVKKNLEVVTEQPREGSLEATTPVVFVESSQPARWQWEVAAISVGAFVAGVLSTVIFGQ
ncbi:hypothetical protein GALMADRAFT_57754 [Galerina marginata CBS 339.88]|uniref:Sensitive to high expression protein 9, mitochondrial n=1 Tax=Galerina marginata (strain CBS 339.88) TaxID=685588 RepID=A0A067TJX4_GALM3|nr:hypothetical protein GALMADRAFT_57754 [Galerina marginata CBS 339.88]